MQMLWHAGMWHDGHERSACPGTARASVVVLRVEGEKVLSNQAVDQHVVLLAAVGYVQVRLLARGTAWQPVRSRVTHHRHMHTNMHAHEQGRGVVWPGTPREVKLAHLEVPIAVVDGAVQLSGPDCTIWATG